MALDITASLGSVVGAPEAWSAVAAVASSVAAVVAMIQTNRTFRIAHNLMQSEGIREIKNIWQSFDTTILSASPRVRQIIGARHFGTEDEDEVTRIYIVFLYLNIAHALFHARKYDAIDPEFELAQTGAVIAHLCNERELTTRLLGQDYGYEPAFVAYIMNQLNTALPRRVHA